MQESAKAHAGVRDYHFYVDPDTGDLVNWESYYCNDSCGGGCPRGRVV